MENLGIQSQVTTPVLGITGLEGGVITPPNSKVMTPSNIGVKYWPWSSILFYNGIQPHIVSGNKILIL